MLGAVFWGVFGWLAAEVFSRMPGGAREGGGAMAGFFFVGPACGLLGLLLGAWGVWKWLAEPARTGATAAVIFGTLMVFVIAVMAALQPRGGKRDDFPGKKAEFRVEVSFPAASFDSLAAADRLEFQLRSGDGTEATPGLRNQVRREEGRAIVPGAFPILVFPRTKLLAVMKNDEQMMCYTLDVEGGLEGTSDWSGWQKMEAGFEARWRLVVTEK